MPDDYHRDTPAGNDHLVLHHLQRLNPLVAFAMHKQLLLFIAALTFSATARAEASLADLIFMMPKLVLMGIYNELARPWLLAGLWGAAALFWLVRAITGRDAVGELLDTFTYPRKPWINTSSYGAMALLAMATLLYVLVGYALWGAPQRYEGPRFPQHSAQPSQGPGVKHTLPYPHGKSPDNRRGEWPKSSGRLLGQPYLAAGGDTLITLGNPGDEGLWVRLCAADANPCSPLRQVYLSPRGGYTLDRVDEGRYRVVFTQTSGKNLSGSTRAFSVTGDRRGSFNLPLNEFDTKP